MKTYTCRRCRREIVFDRGLGYWVTTFGRSARCGAWGRHQPETVR